MSRSNYWVSPREDGWAAQREGTTRAARVLGTQTEAVAYAHDLLVTGPGGELVTQGRDGKIRSKDTINANDPFPPRDMEH